MQTQDYTAAPALPGTLAHTRRGTLTEPLADYGAAVEALTASLTPATMHRLAELLEATLRLGIALGMSPHRRLGLLQATLEDLLPDEEAA